jgi:hypothetical protein
MATRPTFTPRLEALDDRAMPTGLGRFAVGAGLGGAPRVQVYDVGTGVKIADFLAFENTFSGGVTTAMGDVNNDGVADLIVGAGPGGGPRVRVFNGAAFVPGFNPATPGALIADFFAFESSQRGGVTVATGNFVGGSLGGIFQEVVVGAGPGGGPRVRVFDGQTLTTQGLSFTGNLQGEVVADFFAFESTFRGGVTVAANPGQVGLSLTASDLVVAPGAGGSPRVRLLSGLAISGQRQLYTSFGPNDVIADWFAGDPNTRAGLFVASGDLNVDGSADVMTGTGPGLPAVVTVFNGVAIRNQRAAYTGAFPGDRIDTFSPIANYANGVTVGSVTIVGTGGDGLLYGTGGAGVVGNAVLTRYVPFGTGFTRTNLLNPTFDPALFIGVNVSN